MGAGIAALDVEPRIEVRRQLDHGAAEPGSDGDVSGASTDHADLDRADAGGDGEVIGGIHDADVTSACREARLAADRPDVDFATACGETSAIRKVVETNGAPGQCHRGRTDAVYPRHGAAIADDRAASGGHRDLAGGVVHH